MEFGGLLAPVLLGMCGAGASADGSVGPQGQATAGLKDAVALGFCPSSKLVE
jgi:hypothetical protein